MIDRVLTSCLTCIPGYTCLWPLYSHHIIVKWGAVHQNAFISSTAYLQKTCWTCVGQASMTPSRAFCSFICLAIYCLFPSLLLWFTVSNRSIFFFSKKKALAMCQWQSRSQLSWSRRAPFCSSCAWAKDEKHRSWAMRQCTELYHWQEMRSSSWLCHEVKQS